MGDPWPQNTQNPHQKLVCDERPSVETGRWGSRNIVTPEDQQLWLWEKGAQDARTHRVLFM